MTLTYENLDTVKKNHRVKYLGQRSFHLIVIFGYAHHRPTTLSILLFEPSISRPDNVSPQNCLCIEVSGPNLVHGSFGPAESIAQTASPLVQPFLQGSRLW